MSTATPDRKDGPTPSGWELELFGGPMDGHKIKLTLADLDAIKRRGWVKVRQAFLDSHRLWLYEYDIGTDRYTFTGKAEE